MEALFCLFIVFMFIEHPYVSIFCFVLIAFSCLGGDTNTTYSYVDCENTNTGYLEKRYYADGTYAVSNFSGTGYTYSDGTLAGTSESWFDLLNNEHRNLNGRNEVVSQCWYNPSVREIFDEDTGEKIGYEREVLGVVQRQNL